MSSQYRTPYADDALRADNGTTPEDIREFVERRASDPLQVDGLTIYNFNNHVLNREALRSQADELLYDVYMIPYQASGVWGYIVDLLPAEIRNIEILAYQQSKGRYIAYPNYSRHADPDADRALRSALRDACGDGVI